MIARVCSRCFGTIWKLKERCNRSSSVMKRVYIFFYNWYQYEHGSAISHKAIFDEPPILPRGTKQIIITDTVKIGKNVTIFQQVSIQNDTLLDQNSKAPTIGDNCYIYPGAKIIGDITLGDNVIVGPNAVVVIDIPDNHTINFDGSKIVSEKNISTTKTNNE